MSFIHLHVHSEYSWLDGACNIDFLVQTAIQQKLPAVAITDRNSVAGASRLWHQCIKAGIKPIIGLEIEVLNDFGDGRAFSVILLAKNGSGFANLSRLVTLAHLYDPLAPKITKSQLKTHSENLICLSFSVVGELCTLLLEGKDNLARQVSAWYHAVFAEDYCYEIQNHGLPSEAIAMNKLLNLAYETKIPVVLTNDCHYMQRQDSLAIDALNCIRKDLDFANVSAKRFACNEYYFKTPQEMKSLYGSPPQLIKNTLEIANKIDVTGGYIAISESDLTAAMVADLLKRYSSDLRIKFQPSGKHISVSLMDQSSKALLDHLQKELPAYDILPWTDYQKWTPSSIYTAVLKTLHASEETTRELCSLIPSAAKTLREAALVSTDFSCLSSQDYLCAMATEIADTLIDTFKEARPTKDIYAIIPKNLAIPIVLDADGNARCQYDDELVSLAGLMWVEFI